MTKMVIVLRDNDPTIPFLQRDLRWVKEHVNELVQKMFDVEVESITVKDGERVVLVHEAKQRS